MKTKRFASMANLIVVMQPMDKVCTGVNNSII